MTLSDREFWTVIHGLVLGTLFLLAFAGGLAGLWSLRPSLVTPVGVVERMRRLKVGMWGMAIVAWATVVTGTYTVYPWYRDKAATSAKSRLIADPDTALWHTFGMEWKEHVAWIAPLLATAAAFVVTWYGLRLARENRMRKLVLALFVTAFVSAAIAGLFGAFINKAAPIR
ncbi:MAG TPA: hypothetical protein VFA34_01640 [Actinomycetota bacterium]|jgi:hypothetical protein|nr:hypothetical protein [Actinomycetota bacterium]